MTPTGKGFIPKTDVILRSQYRTVLKQTARITIRNVPLVGGMLEDMLVSHYGPTVSKVLTHRAVVCSAPDPRKCYIFPVDV